MLKKQSIFFTIAIANYDNEMSFVTVALDDYALKVKNPITSTFQSFDSSILGCRIFYLKLYKVEYYKTENSAADTGHW
jgi:hypothetical protein